MKETLHIYTRVSSVSQEEEGTSLETQLELGLERSKKLGMKHKVWNEGGQSSSKDDLGNRPVLVNLLKGIDDGDVKHLYVWNTDRLSRNMNTWGMIRFKLIKNEITLHTPTGKQILSDPQTNLMLGIMSEISQYDNKLRTERFRLGRIHRIKQGFWKGGPPPYGYKLKDGLLEIDKEESSWVKKILEWYLEGDSVLIIKDKLLQNGVVTRRGNPIWSVGSIQNVLTEIPHYQGFWNYHDKKSGDDIRVDCPTSIPLELIQKVKKLCDSRKYNSSKPNRRPNRKHTFLLKELFECGSCSGSFSGWKSDKKQSPYYFCETNKKNHRRNEEDMIDCDSEKNLNMDTTDELVWDVVKDVMSESNLFRESVKRELLDDKSMIQTGSDIKKLERQVKVNDEMMKKISESIVNQETDKLIGIRSEEEIQDVLGKLDEQMLKLRVKKEELQTEVSKRYTENEWTDWVKEWGSRLEEMKSSDFTFEDKKNFIRSVVEKIVVQSDGKIEHELDIQFKLPYVNDKLVWNDEEKKSQGYILKDGGYSKRLRISYLKKK